MPVNLAAPKPASNKTTLFSWPHCGEWKPPYAARYTLQPFRMNWTHHKCNRAQLSVVVGADTHDTWRFYLWGCVNNRLLILQKENTHVIIMLIFT